MMYRDSHTKVSLRKIKQKDSHIYVCCELTLPLADNEM